MTELLGGVLFLCLLLPSAALSARAAEAVAAWRARKAVLRAAIALPFRPSMRITRDREHNAMVA